MTPGMLLWWRRGRKNKTSVPVIFETWHARDEYANVRSPVDGRARTVNVSFLVYARDTDEWNSCVAASKAVDQRRERVLSSSVPVRTLVEALYRAGMRNESVERVLEVAGRLCT